MDDEAGAAGRPDGLYKPGQKVVAVLIVYADPGLDRDRQPDGGPDPGHTLGHPFGICHEAGPKAAALRAPARAADIQVDLIIALGLGEASAARERGRLGPAELYGQRVFDRVVFQQPAPFAPEQGAGGDHFRVEQGMPAEEPHEIAKVPVGMGQHRRDGDPPVDHRPVAGCAAMMARVNEARR